jgi:hypothetical protein
MKVVTVVTALVGLAAAMPQPWTIISKRELTEKDLDERTTCPRMLTQGEYDPPAYITHVSKKEPNKKFGKQTTALFTPHDIGTIFR